MLPHRMIKKIKRDNFTYQDPVHGSAAVLHSGFNEASGNYTWKAIRE